MSNLNFRKRRNRRGFFFHLSRHLPTFIVLFVIALVLGGGIFAFSRFVLKKQLETVRFLPLLLKLRKATGPRLHQQKLIPTIPLGN